MGFDSFGLPAEQYALETGQHPATTTEKNIATFRSQLDKIGFCYDWSREVRTSDPEYYKWTQWIFLQLFDSWYNHKSNKAEPIETLIEIFEENGTDKLPMRKPATILLPMNGKLLMKKNKQEILMDYPLGIFVLMAK